MLIGGLMVVLGLFTAILKYAALPEPPKNQCWYEIKYLHMSSREVTKRVNATCEGFYPWHWSERYKIPATILPFSDGTSITIQGATDILSVAKITENE